MSDKARAGLGSAIERFGDISGITFNVRTGRLVCGHQRVERLRAAGAQMVDGALPASLALCVEDGGVLNVDGPNGFSNPVMVTEAHRCSHERLPTVELDL